MMTFWIIENRLRVDSEHSKRMDPTELSSLNELLDRIAALGVATHYDRIGLKPDQREIKSPPITHQIAIVEEQNNNSSSILRTICPDFRARRAGYLSVERRALSSDPRIG